MGTAPINTNHITSLQEELQKRGATTIANDLAQMAGQIANFAEANLCRHDENYNSTIQQMVEAHKSIATAVEVCRICEAIIAEYKKQG